MDNQVSDQLIKDVLLDRKRDRRWRNIRFLIGALIVLLYLLVFSWPSKPNTATPNQPYVSLVRLNGEILAGKSFSALRVIPQLEKAFKDKRAKGVILVINSPGGSPVQAGIIHDKIEQLKHKYNKKVVVLGQDTLASGAYLVATAADKIFVHPDTLTGSIGVLMGGFGYAGIMHHFGITRRLYTAGVNKVRLDPYSKLRPQDVVKVKALLQKVHQHFINDVLAGRKGKLHGNRKQLFSGDFWEGSTAVKLGLADGTGDLWQVMKTQFKVTHYKNYTERRSLLQMVLGSVSAELNLALTDSSLPVREQLN